MTVVFGDTFDSILDFINDKRIDVAFTEARIVFADGESETRSITGIPLMSLRLMECGL